MSTPCDSIEHAQFSSLATALPTNGPTATPTRRSRGAAAVLGRSRCIGLVPKTYSTTPGHAALTSVRLEAHCKIWEQFRGFAKPGGRSSSSSQPGWRPLAAWRFSGSVSDLNSKRGKSTCLKRARDFRVRLPPPFLTLGGSLYPQPTLPPGQVEVVTQRISISCGLGHCAVGLRGLTHAF